MHKGDSGTVAIAASSTHFCGEMDLSNMPGEAGTSGETSSKLPLELSKSSMGFHGSEFWSEAPEVTANHQCVSSSPPVPSVFVTLASDFSPFMNMSLLMA